MALVELKCTVGDLHRKTYEANVLLNDEMILAIIEDKVIIKDDFQDADGGVTVGNLKLSNIHPVKTK